MDWPRNSALARRPWNVQGWLEPCCWARRQSYTGWMHSAFPASTNRGPIPWWWQFWWSSWSPGIPTCAIFTAWQSNNVNCCIPCVCRWSSSGKCCCQSCIGYSLLSSQFLVYRLLPLYNAYFLFNVSMLQLWIANLLSHRSRDVVLETPVSVSREHVNFLRFWSWSWYLWYQSWMIGLEYFQDQYFMWLTICFLLCLIDKNDNNRNRSLLTLV